LRRTQRIYASGQAFVIDTRRWSGNNVAACQREIGASQINLNAF
jgi:hypothetical protein